jgi:hypothetical protein
MFKIWLHLCCHRTKVNLYILLCFKDNFKVEIILEYSENSIFYFLNISKPLSNFCMCGSDFNQVVCPVDKYLCNHRCPGNIAETCGGHPYYLNFYNLSKKFDNFISVS